jgi:branched-subunit amino acid ABC-type transport system permease component
MVAQIVANSIIIGCVYAVIAFGFTLIYSTMNFFNMAYGAMVLIGAYTYYVLYHLLGWPIAIAAVMCCIITAALMLVVDRICYYRMRQKRVPSWSLVVISMAVALICESAVTILFGARNLTVYDGFPRSFSIFGAYITTIQIAELCATVMIMVLTTLLYSIITVVGSILAAVAAVLVAMDTDIRPAMGGPVLLKAITCSILGGVGNFKGALIAGLVLGLLENLTSVFLGSGWKDAVTLLILVILMLTRPSYFGFQAPAI